MSDERIIFDDEGFVDGVLQEWSTHRAANIGATVSHPAHWMAVDVGDTAAFFAAPPTVGSTSSSNLNILVMARADVPDAIADAAPPPGGEPPDMVELHVATLAAGFDEALVLECEATTVADRPATRGLVAYREEDGRELTLEQWLVPDGDRVVALSATALTLDYPFDFATLHRIVASVRLHG